MERPRRTPGLGRLAVELARTMGFARSAQPARRSRAVGQPSSQRSPRLCVRSLRVRPFKCLSGLEARGSIGIALAVLSLLGLASTASAQTRHALVVAGASGEEQYAKLHREWVDTLVGALRGELGFDQANVTVLTETPQAGEAPANAVNVKAAVAKIAPALKDEDMLFVMLIGHGSGAGAEAKFNLVGPDLTAADWKTLLAPVTARIAFVDASSASAGFLETLAAPERVVVTATNSPAQVYHPRFGQAFIEALTTAEADLDKNERVSVWEAFVFASNAVQQHYEREGTLATEHAMLDDTGDGTGRDAAAAPAGVSLASLTYLDAPASMTSSDPAVQALIDRREALTRQIDELRRQQSAMPDEAYAQEFEKLALELAQVSAEIRSKQP